MSSCGACSSGCKCESGCSCSSCGCCKRNPSLGEEMAISSSQAMILGVTPQKGQLEGFEMAEAESGGCKCGSNCTCDPCNCK